MNSTKTIASRLFVGFTAFALMVGSSPKEANAQITGNGGSTGWNPVSSTSERSCAQKGQEKMKILVNLGEIQTLPNATSNTTRWRKGNNVIFDLVCTKSGGHVRVGIICFNACDSDIFRLRNTIDDLMEW